MQDESSGDSRKYIFPKKVGIVFLERRRRPVQGDIIQGHIKRTIYEDFLLWKKQKDELKLDFNQDACTFLLLHLNHYQNIFDFQVVDILMESTNESHVPKKNDKQPLFNWLDDFAWKNSDLNIDYWIGITAELLPGHPSWHFEAMSEGDTKSQKILWIITSMDWEKYRSPPSLFEYLLATVFRCALQSLSRELELENMEIKGLNFLRSKGHKVTRGCMFDFIHRRTSVSIFKLCLGCQNKVRLLEEIIRDKGKNWDVNLVDGVTNILSKEWMGTPEKRDSPLFNLKKMFKYDVDRNSGFKKGLGEKFRDSISDNLAQWTVGTVVVGLVGIIMALFFKP